MPLLPPVKVNICLQYFLRHFVKFIVEKQNDSDSGKDDLPINEFFMPKLNNSGMVGENAMADGIDEEIEVEQEEAEVALQCAICPSFFSTLEDLEIHFKEHEHLGEFVSFITERL